MKKRLVSICLTAALVVSMLPVSAMAAEEQPDETEANVEETEESTGLDAEVDSSGTIEVDMDALPDNDELFAEYVDRVFYGDSGIATLAATGPQFLDGYALELYTQLKEMATEVADGNRLSTAFSMDVDGFVWTAEELGITSPDEVYDALDEKIDDMMNDILYCLLADCPYVLYWFDKTEDIDFDEQASYSLNPDGTVDEVVLDSLDIFFIVEEAYVDPDSEDPDTTVNVAKTSAAQKAAANAQDIAAEYASLPTEWDKAVAYKEVICDLVSYDYAAVEDPDTPYGDPWQLINVFDGDPETNVVCEGYSKAFKYLCDMGMEDATAYLSSGDFFFQTENEGSHMWNILNLDGCNYLVDVTNSDEGAIGEEGGLFLVDDTDAAYADPARAYVFQVYYGMVIASYRYDEEEMYVYSDDVKTLGSTYALTITQQPSDLTLPVGYSDATLSVKATTDSGAIAYQWYQKNEDGTGTPIEGATDSTFAIPEGMANGTTVTYYCTASQTIHHTGGDEEYVVTSDDAVVTVGETANGLVKGDDGKWGYYVNGKVDTSYTGFAENANGKWYVVNGYVLFDQNTVAKDKDGVIGTAGTWYYVVGSKVQESFTGLANYKNANGWWYIVNGKVDFGHNGVDKNKNGWYYVTGGKVQFGYTGVSNYKNENGWWYIKDGKVDFSANTVAKNNNGWWYVTGGKVQFGFTGLANYKNANGWWYIEGGKVNFNHNGVDKNKNGWWYVTGGKVQFGFTGLANYKNANGWWYIKNGAVDFTHSGVDKNVNGWWYVKGGKVDFSVTTVAKNKNGWWYVYKGKVLFDDALTYAAQFVGTNTTTGQSNSSMLSTCYRVLWSTYSYERVYGDNPSASVMSQYAIDMFKNKKGNCYRYAASFACIAKVLGYNSRVGCGSISSVSGGMTPHGWTEVYNDGQWLICDADMQMSYPNTNVYMCTESNYPYRHTCSARYTLTVTDAGAVWK